MHFYDYRHQTYEEPTLTASRRSLEYLVFKNTVDTRPCSQAINY